jgi:serine/threonine-protein kinase
MTLSSGTWLGSYEILEPLGSGGMGEVYRARDSRLKREVAVKVLPETCVADAEALERFEKEAQIVASLSHPNIMGIHDFGRHEDLSYAVMELLEGETLRERMARAELSPRKAVEIARQIALGLAAAHARGVVHRDLKPENLFVTRDGLVKILDFGLAKQDPSLVDDTPDAEAQTIGHSRDGIILGTQGYMSPEQVRGRPADERSDVFSLGVVIYEMLAGARPFAGDSAADVMGAILRDDPPDLTNLNPQVPPSLRRIVHRCLEKQRHERFQTARDLTFALETISEISDQVQAPGSFGVTPTARDTRSSIAVLPFVNMSPDPEQDYFCEGMAEEIINALAGIEGLRVAARSSAFQFRGSAKDIRAVGDALNVDTVLEGSVRTAGKRMRVTAQMVNVRDGYQLWSDRYDREVADVFAVQDEIAAHIVEALRGTLGAGAGSETKRPTTSLEAYQLYLKGQHNWYKRERLSLHKAADFFEQAVARDPSYALAHAGVSNAYSSLAFYGMEPSAARDKADAAIARAVALDPELADVRAATGLKAVFLDWDWERAERELSGAIEANPSHVLAHCWYSFMLAWTGRGKEAVVQASKARDIDPLSPYTNTSLGLALHAADRSEEAVEALREALDIDSNYLYTMWMLAGTYGAVDRIRDAVSVLERAVLLSDRSSYYLGGLGWAYGAAGQRAEAESIVQELVARSHDEYVPPTSLVQSYSGLGMLDEAFAWLDRALEVGDPPAAHVTLPSFDPLRADPRFASVRQRLGMT